MQKKILIPIAIPLILLAIPLFPGCRARTAFLRSHAERSYYIDGTKDQKEELRDLFTLLDHTPAPGEERFCIVREIADELAKQGSYGKVAHFLTSWVDLHPEDPYDAWLLLMVAHVYLDHEASPPLAAHYFDRIVRNYPDLFIHGQSVHFTSLSKLIEIETDDAKRIWYYQELISHFPDRIDLGQAYFMQGQSYERTGDWAQAMRAYTAFLPYYESTIPGYPDAFVYAKRLVDFNNSPKDWGYERLTDLVANIEKALDEGSAGQLKKYQAKINFFDMEWDQEGTDTHSQAEFRITDYMLGETIHYAPALDPRSNASEAYLKTWGWTQRASTWYLCFRKIYFPADPDIHGRWEWAGIYYGEKVR